MRNIACRSSCVTTIIVRVAEIAQILDIPEGTVHSRLNTARKKMRNHIESEKKESSL